MFKSLSIKNIFKLLSLLVALLFLVVFVIVTATGYIKTIEFIISSINIEKKYHEKIFELVSEKKFLYLKMFIFALFVVFSLLFYFFEKTYSTLSFYAKDLIVSTTAIIKEELTSNTKYIFIIPFLSVIYFACSIPITLDEAGTYIDFVSRGLPAGMSWYYTTNNHIFHSVLAGFTKYIPFLPTLIKLRLGAIVFNLLAIIFGTHFLKKYYNEALALVVMAIMSMLWMNIYYGFLARGYSIVLFCFIASLHFSFNILKDNKTRNWVWLSFTSVIGFYTMPSYLYPFVIINLIILSENYKNINALKKQIIATAIVVGTLIILYLPVFIVNGGIRAVTENKFIVAQTVTRSSIMAQLPSFFYTTIEEIFGFNSYIILITLAVSLIFLMKEKNTFKLKLAAIFIIVPFLLLLVHSVIAFPRTFNYYGFILLFLIVLPFEKYVEKRNTNFLMWFLIIIQIGLFFNFNLTIKNKNKEDVVPITSYEIIVKIAGNNSYLINANYFEGPLIYELKANNYYQYKVEPVLNKKINADTISNVDYIIIDLKDDETHLKKPIYTNQYYNIYKK